MDWPDAEVNRFYPNLKLADFGTRKSSNTYMKRLNMISQAWRILYRTKRFVISSDSMGVEER